MSVSHAFAAQSGTPGNAPFAVVRDPTTRKWDEAMGRITQLPIEARAERMRVFVELLWNQLTPRQKEQFLEKSLVRLCSNEGFRKS